MTKIRSVVLGCGSYLPEQVVTNAQLAARIDTSDEWIVQRTGIRERRIAADGEMTSDLAIRSAEAALKNAGMGQYHSGATDRLMSRNPSECSVANRTIARCGIADAIMAAEDTGR